MDIFATLTSCLAGMNLAYGLIPGLFLGGLVGSLTHCVGMCGPIVLSRSYKLDKLGGSLLIPYHLGRITTYTILALLFNTIVNVGFLFQPERALLVSPILFFAGSVFLVTAFPKTQKLFPWLVGFRLFPNSNRLVSKAYNYSSLLPETLQPFILGIMLGFLPCGLVTAALMAASTAPTPTIAAISMISFGMGTMPALIAVTISGKMISQKYPNASPILARGLMIWSGLWLFALGGLFLL